MSIRRSILSVLVANALALTAVSAQAAVQGDAVHDGTHGKFAYAVVEVVAAEIAGLDAF